MMLDPWSAVWVYLIHAASILFSAFQGQGTVKASRVTRRYTRRHESISSAICMIQTTSAGHAPFRPGDPVLLTSRGVSRLVRATVSTLSYLQPVTARAAGKVRYHLGPLIF